MKSARPSLFLLIILLAFQAIGAIGGGLALVIQPSGAILQMPISMLEHSPFPDFLIPGLFLLIVLGLFPAFVCFALIKKPDCRRAECLNIYKDQHWSWSFVFYVGIIPKVRDRFRGHVSAIGRYFTFDLFPSRRGDRFYDNIATDTETFSTILISNS